MDKGGDGFDPVFEYRFEIIVFSAQHLFQLVCVKRTDDDRRTEDIQATKNDKVRLIIDKSHVQSEFTSTFDSVIYLVAEQRARGHKGTQGGRWRGHHQRPREVHPKWGTDTHDMHPVAQSLVRKFSKLSIPPF